LTAYRKIVVGAHGSPTSEVAEEVAAYLAHQLGAEMFLIHVSDDMVNAEDILRSAAVRARVLGVEPQTVHRKGDVAEAIVGAAADLRADLLVIGDHGMGPSSRFSLGGLPSNVAHHSPIDILVVRTARPARRHIYGRILIATDGSHTAHQATQHGHALASALGAEVGLIYVGDELIGDIVLRDTAARFEGETMDRIVTKGNPATQISKAAEGNDLVVVGNKGMTGSRRYIQRVVPSRVAHEAASDVLIVKTVRRSLFDLRPGEGAVVEVDGDKVAAYLHDDGTTYTLSARCQHMGCIVEWNGRARTWDCPCHGSRYEYTGGIINGPTKRPLPPVQAPRDWIASP
jgi:nucleotide-binding universal stress UspA family protein/nitrite reductase/ring-hydroxylating ferredoxin subunit